MNMSSIEVELQVKQRQRDIFEIVRQIHFADKYRNKPGDFGRRICHCIGDVLIQAGTRLKRFRPVPLLTAFTIHQQCEHND